ncbi:MAG: hypothetical protein WCS94_16025 [Verrucomicrobiota bacterium]
MTKPKNSTKTIATFKDGSSITKDDLLKAEVELNAFLIFFVSVPYRPVLTGKMKRDIGKNRLCESIPATDEIWLDSTVGEQITRTGVRLLRSKLTEKEKRFLVAGYSTISVAHLQARRMIREVIDTIAGRKKGWTLLGVKSERELSKLLVKCYGAGVAREVMACKLVPEKYVLQLVARKIRLESDRNHKSR